MRRPMLFVVVLLFSGLASSITPVDAADVGQRYEYTPEATAADVFGDSEALPAGKVAIDTIWIADWSFEAGGGSCTAAGWVKVDGRIRNDGSNYWVVDNRFNGNGNITGKAAILSRHDLCWESDGYGNNWDYSIVVKYKGSGSTLSFVFLSDTEPGYDSITVEADSANSSAARVDYAVDPAGTPEALRSELFRVEGENTIAISSLALPDFGVPATTHSVYIRLESDGAYSDEDGDYPSFWNAGLVVDNIVITGGLAYTENFEGALNANVTLVNSAPATPFFNAPWVRIFPHITDNDKCTENTTCAWLGTDPLRIAFFPDMAFGPGSAVIRNWLDDLFVSPWVSLASTPTASGTSLNFRRFSGNRFNQGCIVQGWRVRAKVRVDNTDTPGLGDSIDCVSPWGHAQSFNSLGTFLWTDALDGATLRPFDMTTHFDPSAREIQISFRNGDWQFIADPTPPPTLNPGPGPYVDRIRIGRRILTGPTINIGIDTRTQAQDCFPTVQNAIVPGQHFSPDGANRFGTCAFSHGTELNTRDDHLTTGDSIVLENVVDVRNAGGVTSVKLYGAIVSGPHAGKAPAPYTVGGNGFFVVNADSCRGSSGSVIARAWFVDLDDTYFRGGDMLVYFWAATDAAGGFTSAPEGLTALPASIAAAELATNGLYEVSYLPTINWAPAYLARIAAHSSGDLDPTPDELAASTQRSCILYNQHVTSARRSARTQRTAFMYTLDRLGYRDYYDVYDHSGYGNTNNQLGGRANVAQASGYALIIEDDGRSALVPNIPDGTQPSGALIDQAQWYRDYLAQGVSGLSGTATFWLIGENTAFEKLTNPLFTADMGLSGIVNNQGASMNPDVEGVASFTWANSASTSFVGDRFSLSGGCPTIRAYDGASAAGTAVQTHAYKAGATTSLGAIIMNKNATLQWNTVWQGFAWFDMHQDGSTTPGTPGEEEVLATKILAQALPVNCLRSPNPATGVPDPETDAPRVSALHQNVPNPFNPTTTLEFDLARAGHVRLTVFDVAGRVVRTLADGELEAGSRLRVTWNGLDETGQRVGSGVYFYRLDTGEFSTTRKMVMLQ